MSSTYKFRNPKGLYFATMVIQEWLDLFTRKEYVEIVLDNLKYCQQNKGLEIYAWCIMSNHLHVVIRSTGKQDLWEIVRDFKSYSSKRLIEAIKKHPKESRRTLFLERFYKRVNSGYRVWQEGNHPIELWSNSVIDQKINYIHMNPVKAGFMQNPIEYNYSSARDYAGIKGLLDVIIP